MRADLGASRPGPCHRRGAPHSTHRACEPVNGGPSSEHKQGRDCPPGAAPDAWTSDHCLRQQMERVEARPRRAEATASPWSAMLASRMCDKGHWWPGRAPPSRALPLPAPRRGARQSAAPRISNPSSAIPCRAPSGWRRMMKAGGHADPSRQFAQVRSAAWTANRNELVLRLGPTSERWN